MNDHTYDAIVVGTGISGGWAAKELTQNGLKTLVLDRGRMVKHGEYPTAMMNPWEIPYRNRPTQEDLQRQPVLARTGYANAQVSKHWFVDETEDPYIEIQRFDWIRGYHVGGRSIMWGRQSYRWSDLDFEANARDGVAVDWPIRYDDIAPWYDHVEKFIGVSGNNEHLSQLPDGQFLPPMELNCVEKEFRGKVKDKFDRALIIGRAAHLTGPLTHNESPQRSTCRSRNMCIRGCPFGAYFSSVSSTLPSAEKTGNMTLRPNSIVHEIIYDEKLGQGHRRARARRRNRRADRLLREGDFPLRVDVRFRVHHDELDLAPVPERFRQRQRRARPQHHGSSARHRRRARSSKASRIATTAAAARTVSTFRAIATSARTSATICAASAIRAAPVAATGPACMRRTGTRRGAQGKSRASPDRGPSAWAASAKSCRITRTT